MAGKDRERALAREHFERQQARRAEQAARARRRSQVVAAAVAVAAVLAGILAVGLLTRGGDEVSAVPDTADSAAPESAPDAGATPGQSPGAAQPCPPGESAPAAAPTFAAAPELALEQDVAYTATLATSCGDITVELLAEQAPETVNSFAFLAGEGFFEGTPCHRLTTAGIFVLQCGDPTGTGTGGPGYTIPLENAPADGVYPAGTLAMARSQDPDSGGSQFFLVYEETALPAPGYSVFGRVTSGLETLQQIAAGGVEGGAGDGAPATPVTLESVQVSPPVAAAPAE